jgi:glycosyltransferase involved in cell wall biosynthesis
MRLAYATQIYKHNGTAGGDAHIRQFVENTLALGHELWMWPWRPHPKARALPQEKWARWKTLRQMDVVYARMEGTSPRRGPERWALSPYKHWIGSPLCVWEFNSAPQSQLLWGCPEAEVRHAVETLRQHAADCDLAVCVSNKLAEYVRDTLHIPRALVVPNGSDPDLFRPDAPRVARLQDKRADQLHVVWTASANVAWHNFALLRDAAHCLWQSPQRNKIAFHIIGEGIREMHTVPPNVHYYGPSPYETLPSWLAAMDVGLCLYEPGASDFGSPLKLYDYMASGLAVIGTAQPQLRDVFDQLDQADLIVPHDDPKQLATILCQLADNRDRVRAQGRAGRKLVVDFYNWRRAAKDTLEAIEKLRQQKTK